MKNGMGRHRPIGEGAAAPQSGPKLHRPLGRGAEPGPFDVGREPSVQIMAHGGLPGFAVLLDKQKRALVALVAQILDPQPGDGSDAAARVDQGPQDGPVAKTDDVGGLDGGQQQSPQDRLWSKWGRRREGNCPPLPFLPAMYGNPRSSRQRRSICRELNTPWL